MRTEKKIGLVCAVVVTCVGLIYMTTKEPPKSAPMNNPAVADGSSSADASSGAGGKPAATDGSGTRLTRSTVPGAASSESKTSSLAEQLRRDAARRRAAAEAREREAAAAAARDAAAAGTETDATAGDAATASTERTGGRSTLIPDIGRTERSAGDATAGADESEQRPTTQRTDTEEPLVPRTASGAPVTSREGPPVSSGAAASGQTPRVPERPQDAAASESGERTADAPSTSDVARGPAPVVGEPTVHTVKPGDRLLWLVEEHYGGEEYLSAVVAANPGLDPDRIIVGQQIKFPPRALVVGDAGPASPTSVTAPTGVANRTAPATAAAAATVYTVKSGDVLIRIIRNHYGDAAYLDKVIAANPGLNPDRIAVGQKIKLPAKDASTTAAATPTTTRPAERAATPRAGRATYVIEQGDTLIKIAKNVLKDANRWREIWELNKDRLKSPDVVPLGFELKMPPVE